MAERNLPARLEQQNERIQATEDKIQDLEARKQDGQFLANLKKKLELERSEKREIENIYSLSDVELAEIKAKAKALALVAYKSGEYELYKNYELIAKSNETGLVQVTDDYKKQLTAVIPAQYLELKEVDPKDLEARSKDEGKVDLKEQEEREEQENTVDKMEEDTGLELVSLVRIEDENFSRDVVGYETGYAEQYVGITKDGTICLLGLRPDNKFELNPSFVGARTARVDEQPENECGDSSVDMVVPRSDGSTSNLGIDISYGQITLTNRSTNEPIETANYRPSKEEVERAKLEEEKAEKERIEEEIEKEKEEEERKRKEQEAEEEEHGWPGERTIYPEE